LFYRKYLIYIYCLEKKVKKENGINGKKNGTKREEKRSIQMGQGYKNKRE
jgi:hypothetical protein